MKQNIIIGGYQGSASIHTKSIEYFISEISNNFVIDFKMDVLDFSFTGKQELVYTNNSPDTITKV